MNEWIQDNEVATIQDIAKNHPKNFRRIVSKFGGNILHVCVENQRPDIIPIVAQHVYVHERDMYGRTALEQVLLHVFVFFFVFLSVF